MTIHNSKLTTRLLLSLFVVLIIRRSFVAWAPMFPGELILEDIILLFILLFGLSADRFRPLLAQVIGMLLLFLFNGCAWAAREPQFSMIALVFYRGLFGLLVLRAAALLFSEATRAARARTHHN